MSTSTPATKTSSTPKIYRNRTGCKTCRRRGKRCDETRPICEACQRLSLSCLYGINFYFHNISSHELQEKIATNAPPRCSQTKLNAAAKCDTSWSDSTSPLSEPSSGPCSEAPSNSRLPVTLGLGRSPEIIYFRHFDTHVRYLLPTPFQNFTGAVLSSPCLRSAILCLAASNLSMLDAHAQQRYRPKDVRRSLFSPIVNLWHHSHAQYYHDIALRHHDMAQNDKFRGDKAELLVAKVLLAFYHHASSDHLRFRIAVWDTVRLVLPNKMELMNSPSGKAALQLWHRLCTSHRPSKPPALLLEGEGPSTFGPNLTLPDSRDHLYLTCVLGMNADDLIYDIVIKTVEIRARIVVFRCTAGIYNISEQSKDLGGLAHALQNQMLGRLDNPQEHAEAEAAFVQGSHLLELLETQKARLHVWESRLRPDQLQLDDYAKHLHRDQSEVKQPALVPNRFRTHRDTMNALYHHLCNVVFEEAGNSYLRCRSDRPDSTDQAKATSIGSMLHNMLGTIESVDFTQSNTSDVYTLSLAEVLLQLVLTWQSTPLFNHILDVIWPRIEDGTHGYEHSHYPTHLVKRIIALLAKEWCGDRGIFFVLLSVSEEIPKLTLLDLDNPVDLVVYGRHACGDFFVEKKPLP